MNAFRTRFGAMAGIFGGILMVVAALVVPSPPSPDDTATQYRDWVIDKRGAIRWQLVLFALAMMCIIWFAASFGALMNNRGASAVWSAVPAIGVAGIPAMAFGGLGMAAAVAWRGASSLDATLVRLAWDAGNVATTFIGVTAVVALLAAALLIMQTKALPVWTAWLALLALLGSLLAVFALIFDASASALAPGGFVSGLGSILLAAIWIVATAVTMLRVD